MFKAIFYTHLISVNLFLLIYLIKTILLLANKNEGLAKFSKRVKIPEMIISTLFLVSGIYLLTQVPEVNTMMITKIIIVLASIPLAVIGFKKSNKVLAVLSLLMIIGAYGLAEMSKMKKASAQTVNSVNGHVLYIENCARCHGEDGKAQLMDSPDLSVSPLDLAGKIEIIKNGKGAMTGFAGLLTEGQIKAVAEYTEKLKN